MRADLFDLFTIQELAPAAGLLVAEPVVPAAPDDPFGIASIASMWRIASEWTRLRFRRLIGRIRGRRRGAAGGAGGRRGCPARRAGRRRRARRRLGGVVGAAGGVGSVGAAAGGVLGGSATSGLGWAAAAAGSTGVAGDAAGEALADAPPAAFSNSIRCVRNSTSLARIVGSTVLVPLVPTAPAAPGAGVAGRRCRGTRPRADRQPGYSGSPVVCCRTHANRCSC